jgi:hypothetical protein
VGFFRMFYKGVLNGPLVRIYRRLPLMLAVDCRWESVAVVCIHGSILTISAT